MTHIQVDVVDELVQVLEPRVGIHVVEVAAHGEHDIVLKCMHIFGVDGKGSRPYRPHDLILVGAHPHKVVDNGLHIIVLQRGVILNRRTGRALVPVKTTRRACNPHNRRVVHATTIETNSSRQ